MTIEELITELEEIRAKGGAYLRVKHGSQEIVQAVYRSANGEVDLLVQPHAPPLTYAESIDRFCHK